MEYQDHPRRCGENKDLARYYQHQRGSPPQVRGKLILGIGYGSSRGITPAGAGKTYSACNFRNRLPGSPPRMRGKLPSLISAAITLRITPADAGKTDYAQPAFAAEEDHPRGCGENYSPIDIFSSTRGSPPRMRGKPLIFVCSIGCIRITPADAGKTL